METPCLRDEALWSAERLELFSCSLGSRVVAARPSDARRGVGRSKVVLQRMLIFIYMCFARLHGLQRTRGVRSYVTGVALLGGGRPVALVGICPLPRFVVKFLLRS